MGSCMSSNTGDGGVVAGNNSKTKAFSGTGNRLGSSSDPPASKSKSTRPSETLPKPRVDRSLTASDRDQQREARLAAAKKRQEASGGKPTKPKASSTKGQPLRGPNSEPLMRWTA